MTKILLWILVILAVLFVLRLLNAAKAKRANASRGAPQTPQAETPQAETMIRCARCGVYLPRADATAGPNGLTCGEAGCAKKR